MLSNIDDDSKELCEVCGRKVGDSRLLIGFKECKKKMFLCSKRCRREFIRRFPPPRH